MSTQSTFWNAVKSKSPFERIVFAVTIAVACSTCIFGAAIYILQNNSFVFWCSIGYILILIALPFALRHSGVQPVYNRSRLLAVLYFAFVGDIILNGLGGLGWYRLAYHYDDLVHFAAPILGVIFCSAWAIARLHSAETYADVYIALWSMAGLVFAFTVLWEPAELLIDYLFHVETSGQYGQNLDTLYDMLMDCAGVIVGRVIMQYAYRPLTRWLREP